MNTRKELAELICHGSSVLNPRKWLAQEVNDLATRITHLDEIPLQAILVLAKLVADGDSDTSNFGLALDLDANELGKSLDALDEFKFVEGTLKGFKATELGEQAIDNIGQKMVNRELFEMKARLQQLESLSEHLTKA